MRCRRELIDLARRAVLSLAALSTFLGAFTLFAYALVDESIKKENVGNIARIVLIVGLILFISGGLLTVILLNTNCVVPMLSKQQLFLIAERRVQRLEAAHNRRDAEAIRVAKGMRRKRQSNQFILSSPGFYRPPGRPAEVWVPPSQPQSPQMPGTLHYSGVTPYPQQTHAGSPPQLYMPQSQLPQKYTGSPGSVRQSVSPGSPIRPSHPYRDTEGRPRSANRSRGSGPRGRNRNLRKTLGPNVLTRNIRKTLRPSFLNKPPKPSWF